MSLVFCAVLWNVRVNLLSPLPSAATVHRWEPEKDHRQDPEVQAQPAALPHTRSSRSAETGTMILLGFIRIKCAVVVVALCWHVAAGCTVAEEKRLVAAGSCSRRRHGGAGETHRLLWLSTETYQAVNNTNESKLHKLINLPFPVTSWHCL